MNSPRPTLYERINAIRNDPHYAGRLGLPTQLTFLPGGSDGNRLIQKRDSSFESPPGAVLRVIAQISRKNHTLLPHGTYNPAYKFNGEDVTKAKLRFHLVQPRDLGFASAEFNTFVENLAAIHDNDLSFSPHKMLRPFESDKGVTVLHQLVIPRGDDDDDDDSDIDIENGGGNFPPNEPALDNPFSFEGWPVSPDGEWRRELDSVKDTHDIYPLQAYSYKGELIRPSDYTRKLAGAIVDLSFTLVHYNFGKSSRMCLYMTELHVLVPPKPLPGSPVSTRRGVIRR
ncbi:hypothetical protein SCHPADRAFT_253199 [Schizopora paradoxa]|uniref:Uncharacterized protein n=1 Tax=Schizopora paradoxa TaxID=27342 RepID=A0A0H2RUK9_9AGAM|nr:hypothetical protein SCHPADRAFT_253199 [Schizopora paradoxa]